MRIAAVRSYAGYGSDIASEIAKGTMVNQHGRRLNDIEPDAKQAAPSGPLHRVRGLFLRRKINLDLHSVRIRKHYPPLLSVRLTKIICNVVIPELIEQSPKSLSGNIILDCTAFAA